MATADMRPTLVRPLTERQQRVVECLCRGHGNAAIARALGISVNTVKGHIIAIDNLLVGARDAEVSRRERVRLWGLFRTWDAQRMQHGETA
jgi:DNA-binding NarL/FixJ family response regulator